MDTMRGQDDIGGSDAYDYGAIEAPPVISAQERRMHVRAYNYWVSLLGNRSLPSIEDLNPEDMEEFAPNSVLLDFSMGLENPAIIYLGSGLREECGITGTIERANEVPARSLLSRLTDHYLQIIANAAPVGFEAEFTNQRGEEIMYRGILMPFSSNDETIDFIYGVISWKEMAGKKLIDGIDEEIRAALTASPTGYNTAPIWADGPSATADYDDEEDESVTPAALASFETDDFGFEDVEAEADEAGEAGSGFFDEVEADDAETAERAEQAEEGIAAEGEDSAGEEGADDDDGLVRLPEQDEDALDLSAFLAADDMLELAEVAPEETGDMSGAGAFGYAAANDEGAGTDPAAADDDIAEDVAASALDAVREAPVTPVEAVEVTKVSILAPGASLAFRPAGPVKTKPAKVPANAGLRVALDAARRSAEEVRDCDMRGRSALYRAVSNAYDFALSAQEAREDYEAMLEAAGITVQERSPMTAVIKLVFGAHYDKTRVAEYALALDYAAACGLSRGALALALEAHEGGLKGLVQDMREARRSGDLDRPARRIERAKEKLGHAKPADINALPFDEQGLAVVVARREADGSITLVAGIDLEDKAAQKVMIAASKLV